VQLDRAIESVKEIPESGPLKPLYQRQADKNVPKDNFLLKGYFNKEKKAEEQKVKDDALEKKAEEQKVNDKVTR
jgi:hypothetical protein